MSRQRSGQLRRLELDPPGLSIQVFLERGKDVRMFQYRGARGNKSVGTQKRESMWLRNEEAPYMSRRVDHL